MLAMTVALDQIISGLEPLPEIQASVAAALKTCFDGIRNVRVMKTILILCAFRFSSLRHALSIGTQFPCQRLKISGKELL